MLRKQIVTDFEGVRNIFSQCVFSVLVKILEQLAFTRLTANESYHD